MQPLYFYYSVAVLYFIHNGSSQEVQSCFSSEWLTSVKMSMKIAKAGFHRELQYSIQYGKVDHDVKALSVQKLPSGVYMDEYQLANLREDTGLEVLLDSKLDLEAPEYLSTEFTAFIFLSTSENSGQHAVMVPVHARYHRPSDTGHLQVKVDIESPRLLIRSDQCKIPPPGSSHVVVEAPCTLSNVSLCSWLKILDLQETGPVSLEIPVGDATQTVTVCIVTVLVTLLSCSLILRAMWKHSTYNHSKKTM
ncbi:Phosphatidylinositol-glycan biosynthesis class X protein [Triplophysa tibetana]|uniref:Phosphatidylinositol-glycan biosynthesis class X protein n=1 Tax=Triplophysa tibetana TaxID=1572043 RepID=A0A5A9NPC5_9TELE|nr:Phosphatidylinositol-glycan biosynthesis class X protein [Triplophysa tibetana]